MEIETTVKSHFQALRYNLQCGCARDSSIYKWSNY